jgi:hypothetical protein
VLRIYFERLFKNLIKQNKNFNLLFLKEEAQPVSSRSSSFTRFHPEKRIKTGLFEEIYGQSDKIFL